MANPLRYWDALAQKGWEEEVLSTIDSDKKQVLRSVINEYARAARQSASAESETVAFDFGAGSGRYLHSLAPAFDRVIAVDISPKLVDMMQALVGSNGWTHVQCGVEDVASSLRIGESCRREEPLQPAAVRSLRGVCAVAARQDKWRRRRCPSRAQSRYWLRSYMPFKVWRQKAV